MDKGNREIFELQKKYFHSGITRTVQFRVGKLKELKQVVKEHEAEILEAIYKDFGKPEFEQYMTEVGLFYDEINLFIRKLKRWMRPERHTLPILHFPCTGKMVKEPYGVTLIISPFNYPFSLLFQPLLGAIAGGNCVMIKPSEHNVHYVKVLQKILNGFFEEGFIYVCDPARGKDVVNELLEFDFNYIFFTGSTFVGKIVAQKAAKKLIPVTLELGGKSPCIVTEHANIKLSAKRIAWGKMLNAGQTCVAPDYLIVHESVKEIFLQELKREIEVQYGNNLKKNKEYAKMINAGTVHRLKEYLSEGTIYSGGEYDVEHRYFSPTILVDVDEDASVMQDEIFGPVLPVLTYQVLDDIVEHMRKKPSPLALYVFTKKKDESDYLVDKISSGGAMVNDVLLQVATPKFPFGGVGQSGMGNYHGKYSMNTFTQSRTILTRSKYIEIPLRFAPYRNKIIYMKKFLK